jgi:hypothetical protein
MRSLFLSICAGAALALSLITAVSSAQDQNTSTNFGTLNFDEASPDLMSVNYTVRHEGEEVMISAVVPYFDVLRTSTPVTARHFWYTPFYWKIPQLSVHTQNSTDHDVSLNRISLKIKKSEIDKMPIPIFYDGMTGGVAFYNDGWGGMLKTKITLGILDYSYCERNPVSIDEKLFRKTKTVAFSDSILTYDVPVWDLIGTDMLNKGEVCAVGVLSYSDEIGHPWRVPFRAVVLLHPPGAGAPAPPNANYDVFLKAGKSGYSFDVPISQTVAAKGADNFSLSVFSDKSATFELAAAVFSVDGNVVTSSEVKLDYFRPRSIHPPSTPDSVLESIDAKYLDVKTLQPFISSIKIDPVSGKDFVIFATEDWMFLTQSRRDAIHEQIESGLKKLNLTEGAYCYRLPAKDCVRTGTFVWREESK